MPDRFTLPVTAEQWAAVNPNETDYELGRNWLISHEHPASGAVMAAAARLLERERCKDEDAHLLAGYLSTLPGNTDKHPSEMLPEARRILEDAK